ncbi:MAG: hypothetical protein QM770_16280 [Tepidisphaeraceae bacterium]
MTASVLGSALLVLAACVCWGWSKPAPGERSLAGEFVLSMRFASIALACLAQVLMLTVGLPNALRPRFLYTVASWSLGGTAALAASVAVALRLVA